MLSAALFLIAGAADRDGDALSRCLQTYAQVQMFTTKTAAAIALTGLDACAPERQALRREIRRSGGPDADAAVAAAERRAVLGVIAFVNRYR